MLTQRATPGNKGTMIASSIHHLYDIIKHSWQQINSRLHKTIVCVGSLYDMLLFPRHVILWPHVWHHQKDVKERKTYPLAEFSLWIRRHRTELNRRVFPSCFSFAALQVVHNTCIRSSFHLYPKKGNTWISKFWASYWIHYQMHGDNNHVEYATQQQF